MSSSGNLCPVCGKTVVSDAAAEMCAARDRARAEGE